MFIQAYITEATIETAPSMVLRESLDVEITICKAETSDSIRLALSEAVGWKIVEKLTAQLQKVDEIAKSRKEAQEKMLQSIEQLQGK